VFTREAAKLPGRVSAIVVAHRSADDLSQLLPTLTEVADEIVVVDNGSADAELSRLIEGTPKTTLLARPNNDGFAVGVNMGVANSSGEFILLINPDIRAEASALDALIQGIRRHGDAIVGPTVRFPDGSLQKTRSGWPSLWNLLGEQVLIPESATPGRFPARLWTRWRQYDEERADGPLSGCCLLFSRKVWDLVGPFDERYFLYWEEVDWQIRSTKLGFRSWLIPDSVVVHTRAGSTSAHDPRRADMFYRSFRHFLLKWFSPPMKNVAWSIVWAGQAFRWTLWGALRFARKRDAEARRAFHRQAMRTLREPP